jgi:ribonuclease/clavin/mitogillin
MNIANIGYHATNYYVLADTAPRLLVDAGWPGSLAEMQHAAERMGMRLRDIPYQLATHYHPDHAGLSQELKALGIKLIVVDTQVSSIPLLKTHTKPSDNFTDINMEGNIIITEAESRAFLEGIGLAGEIISTPGHSDDSVTLILDGGEAFTGDLTPPVGVPNDPNDLAYRSWQNIRAKGGRTIYPGHGPARPLGRLHGE